VEIWTRACKEEEKAAMEKYCEEHGAEEVEKIQKAIEDRHARELATKKALESAKPAFMAYKESLMK